MAVEGFSEGFSVRASHCQLVNIVDQADATEGDGNDTDNDVFRSGSESPQYTLPIMPDAKQRRATVSGGSPTFEHSSLIVEDPVIRPKSQFINKAERDAALAILSTAESSLKVTASGNGGKEVEVGRKESERLRMTSSDSTGGLKRPSESEADDCVFASDKEDQQSCRQPAGEGKPQEFRVTKPTPVSLEPAGIPAKSPLAKTPSSSSSSSAMSSGTLSSSVPRSSVDSGSTVTDPGSSNTGQSSRAVKWRPPSPVSAPPQRKKSLTTTLSGEGRVQAGTGRKESEPGSGMVPSPLAAEVVRTEVSRTVSSASSGSSAMTAPPGSPFEGSGKEWTGRRMSSDRSSVQSKDSRVDSSSRGSVSSQAEARTAEEASQRQSDIRRGDKSKPLVLEAAGVAHDNRPQSVQQAIHTEVATDTPHKDSPQLMKIKKLESPTAADAPELVSESASTPKHKKRVEFSADAKESSPPQEVSYTHIVVGGVVQKIPVESASTESPPVRMRQKSGNRRLDRRVSCKDLGKGDCEGWLYKRKEKDHRLAKHWSKHWCVLKNFNLYYYKNKEELKAKGVIYLPAFQVSPAVDLKTKKFPFKVHNAGTTFYFASERQDDMSKWMNKMGLAAIGFDTSKVVTTGGFIKPEPRSHLLGVANAYYSESEDEVEEGSSQYGSALSLNSVSSLGSATVPHPSPPLFKRALASVSSDPGVIEAKTLPQGGAQPKQGPGGGFKSERRGSRV